MADTNDTAAVIKELQDKPQVPIKGNTSDFLKKFSQQQSDEGKPSATNMGDPMLGLRKNNEEEMMRMREEKEREMMIKEQEMMKMKEENEKLKKVIENYKSLDLNLEYLTNENKNLRKVLDAENIINDEKHIVLAKVLIDKRVFLPSFLIRVSQEMMPFRI